MYAGMAIMNATAEWNRPAIGEGIAKLAGVAAFVLYVLVVIAVPVTLSGFVGSLIRSAK